MKENKLVKLSMDFSVDIINLVKFLKSKHSMHKEQKILYQNLKLRLKKQAKRDIGLSSYTGQSISMSKLSKRYPPNALL